MIWLQHISYRRVPYLHTVKRNKLDYVVKDGKGELALAGILLKPFFMLSYFSWRKLIGFAQSAYFQNVPKLWEDLGKTHFDRCFLLHEENKLPKNLISKIFSFKQAKKA